MIWFWNWNKHYINICIVTKLLNLSSLVCIAFCLWLFTCFVIFSILKACLYALLELERCHETITQNIFLIDLACSCELALNDQIVLWIYCIWIDFLEKSTVAIVSYIIFAPQSVAAWARARWIQYHNCDKVHFIYPAVVISL